MPTVFLSYSRDDLPRIEQLEAQLKTHPDISIWLDTEDLHGGERWPKRLGEAIADQDVFLLAWSKKSAASHFVEFEWCTAIALKKTVVLCLLDETPLAPSLKTFQGYRVDDATGLIKSLRSAPLADVQRREPVIRKLSDITAREEIAVMAQAKTVFAQQQWAVQDYFLGRDEFVKQIVADIRSAIDGTSEPSRLVQVISGAGGLGKTAVATAVAQELRTDFPDGQYAIYFNTHTGNPISVKQARNNLLLECYSDWKPDESEATNWKEYNRLFCPDRSDGVSRKVLLILDDCKDDDQLKEIKPRHSCPVIVTARTRFTDGVDQEIHPLDPADAAKLLCKIFEGDLVVPGIADAQKQLAEQCGYFPLMLKAAAGYLKRTKRKGKDILDFINKLKAYPADAFPEEKNPYQVFEYSLRELSDQQCAALCSLLVMTTDFDRDTACAVGGCTGETIDLFITSYLIQVRGSGRCFWHDVMRVVVKKKLLADIKREAWKRYIEYFTVRAREWSAPFIGGRGDFEVCYKRFDEEISHIEAVMRYLLEHEQLHHARCELSDALHPRLHVQLDHDFLVQWYWKVLESARINDNFRAQAYAHLGLGDMGYRRSESDRAITHYREACKIFRETHNRNGEVYGLVGLANVADGLKDYPSARSYWESALTISEKIDYFRATVNALMGLGGVACLDKDNDRALMYYDKARWISYNTGNFSGEADAHSRLGDLAFIEQENDEARVHYLKALEIGRKQNYSHSERYALMGLGQLSCKKGDMASAQTYYKAALDISQMVGTKKLSESISAILQELR